MGQVVVQMDQTVARTRTDEGARQDAEPDQDQVVPPQPRG